MLSVSQSKIEHRKFILLARFGLDFVREELIPEIERYQDQSSMSVHKEFEMNKFSKNGMYFHHSYAYADIPAGQEYEMIARIKRGKLQPESVMECKTKILHFFSVYKTQLLEHANHGHHEHSLIQFQDGIPDMIYELYEINEKKPLEIGAEICLCSYDTLRANLGQ